MKRWLPMVLVLVVGCGPAQLGPDREAFRAVDALFTAVSAKDEKLLADCEGRLDALRDAGQLAEPAHASLAATVAQARSGDWDSARRDLRQFMKGQRRSAARD